MRSLMEYVVKCLKQFGSLDRNCPSEEDKRSAEEMCLKARQAGVCPSCCEKCAWGRFR